MKFNLEAPLNDVSFGQTSFGLLTGAMELGVETRFYPTTPVVTSPYSITQEISNFINKSINDFSNINASEPVVNLWHINELQRSHGKKKIGFTFHETDRLTSTETNILNQLDLIIVSSDYTKSVFEQSVVTPIKVVPLGFDKYHFKIQRKDPKLQDKIVFGLFGKLEGRKATTRIIKNWVSVFGNNPNFILNACVSNKMLSKEEFNLRVQEALGGKVVSNVNFLPFFTKNTDFNTILNTIDIDLTGMSLCEGWNLPAFQNIALGKNAIVFDAHAHKMYANEDNAILVKPNGKMVKAVDNICFTEGGKFNQGYWQDFDDSDLIEAMKLSTKLGKQLNINGIKLQEDFTYKKTVEKILSALNEL